MTNVDLVCMQCGRDFYVTDADQEFFKDKGFSLPKNCWDCRQRRKEDKKKRARSAVKRIDVENVCTNQTEIKKPPL